MADLVVCNLTGFLTETALWKSNSVSKNCKLNSPAQHDLAYYKQLLLKIDEQRWVHPSIHFILLQRIHTKSFFLLEPVIELCTGLQQPRTFIHKAKSPCSTWRGGDSFFIGRLFPFLLKTLTFSEKNK